MATSISTRSIANVTLSFGAFANFEAKIFAAAREEGTGLNLVAVVETTIGDVVTKTVVKPVQQYAVNGTVIPFDKLQRGVERGDDSFILIPQNEIEACKAATNKAVAITKFIPLTQVDPVYFDKSYILAPNVDKKDKNPNSPAIVAYALLLATLEAVGMVGQAKLEMRGKEHNVIIRASNGVLMMHTMFNTSEIRSAEIKRPTFEMSAELVEQGKLLINSLAGSFEADKLTSTSDEKLAALIARKIAQSDGTVTAEASETETPSNGADALLNALKASVNAAPKTAKATS